VPCNCDGRVYSSCRYLRISENLVLSTGVSYGFGQDEAGAQFGGRADVLVAW
jgi:hypothetical protein